MSDEEAWNAFVQIRFVENEGEPFCPRCKCAALYTLRTRRQWRCKNCSFQFSVTSETIFAAHKLPLSDILFAIGLYVNGAKGLSALQLCRDLNVQHKTAFVLLHKLREALGKLQHAHDIVGPMEVDGAWFGGKVRKINDRKNQPDLRKLENMSPNRRCVIVMRERNGRSRPFVRRLESEGVKLVAEMVEPGSVVYADDAKHFDPLHAIFDMRRIDHSKHYAVGDISTNWAESYFARTRRSQIGVHHHFSPHLLQAYADEMSWREDHRGLPNGDQFLTIVAAGLHHPVSRYWKGYWQRRRMAA